MTCSGVEKTKVRFLTAFSLADVPNFTFVIRAFFVATRLSLQSSFVSVCKVHGRQVKLSRLPVTAHFSSAFTFTEASQTTFNIFSFPCCSFPSLVLLLHRLQRADSKQETGQGRITTFVSVTAYTPVEEKLRTVYKLHLTFDSGQVALLRNFVAVVQLSSGYEGSVS